jgi:hypothetical protein
MQEVWAVILVIKRFRLREGVEDDAFVTVDQRLQRDLTCKQPGLLRCVTAKTTDGEWLVVHRWTSSEAADAPSGRGAAVVDEWMELIDASTASMERIAAVA